MYQIKSANELRPDKSLVCNSSRKPSIVRKVNEPPDTQARNGDLTRDPNVFFVRRPPTQSATLPEQSVLDQGITDRSLDMKQAPKLRVTLHKLHIIGEQKDPGKEFG
jgi:hypothetical protein